MSLNRILIVEDNKEKLQAIVQVVTQTGVSREAIKVAQCAFDAKVMLKQEAFDLAILDIMLPERNEDQPSQETGIELIEHLARATGPRPQRVIGLTAFESLRESFHAEFSRRLWSLLYYDEASDGWRNHLRASLEYLSEEPAARTAPAFGLDVCVLTALRTPELEAVLDLPCDWSSSRPLDDNTFIIEGKFTVADKVYRIAAASAPRMGMVAAALLAAKLIGELRPRVLAMTGICAGVNAGLRMGDVILASPVWEWQSGKRVLSGEHSVFNVDPDQIAVSAEVVSRFEQLVADASAWAAIYTGFKGQKPEAMLRAHVGPVATGSVVLADPETVEEIKVQHRKLLGVEMEIYGVYAAARFASRPKPLTLALKSVSDFADSRKDDRFQQYAAHTSAQALWQFLTRYMPDLHRLVGE